MNKIKINENQRELISTVLNKFVPEYPVFAFGSRVTGTEKPFSDLDLIILSDKPIPPLTMYHLNHAFDESILPFKIDLLDSSSISDDFRKIIEKEWVPF